MDNIPNTETNMLIMPNLLWLGVIEWIDRGFVINFNVFGPLMGYIFDSWLYNACLFVFCFSKRLDGHTSMKIQKGSCNIIYEVDVYFLRTVTKTNYKS